ncbi:hypothetical protein FRC08_017430 [Ceratobasidium sp. 394]|nr:hypothetical protein FRC08_017430 [Ceratobasidium sp. 394]
MSSDLESSDFESSGSGSDSDSDCGPVSKCPCCLEMLSQRQIDRHIEEYGNRMVLSSSDVEMDDSEASDDSADGSADDGPGAVDGFHLDADQAPGQMPIDIPDNIDPAVLVATCSGFGSLAQGVVVLYTNSDSLW